MPPEHITCPCCGYKTLSAGPGAYEICPVCRWEDDGMPEGPFSVDGPNGISLAEAQQRYSRYGSAHILAIHEARPPRPDEARDVTWKPVLAARDIDPQVAYLRDLGPLLELLITRAKLESDSNGERARGVLSGLRSAMLLILRQAERFGFDNNCLGLPSDLTPDEIDPARGQTGVSLARRPSSLDGHCDGRET